MNKFPQIGLSIDYNDDDWTWYMKFMIFNVWNECELRNMGIEKSVCACVLNLWKFDNIFMGKRVK